MVSNERSFSPMNNQSTYLDVNYRNFGGIRNGFHNSSNLDRPSNNHTSPLQYIPEGGVASSRMDGIECTGLARRASGNSKPGGFPGPGGVVQDDIKYLQNPTLPPNAPFKTPNHVCMCAPASGARWPDPTEMVKSINTNTIPYQPLPLSDLLNPETPTSINSFQTDRNGQDIYDSFHSTNPRYSNDRTQLAPSFLNPDPDSVFDPTLLQPEGPKPWIYNHVSSPSPINSTFSILSNMSTNTIRPQRSIQEQRFGLLVDLYNTCLNATQTYIRVRRDRRHHPYRREDLHFRSQGGNKSSLMDNISQIATHVWRRARNSLMAPHRAEVGALKTMGELYEWAEAVVRGIDGEDVDGGSVEELGMGTVEVGEAAKKLCGVLRAREAVEVCERILAQLRNLGGDGGVRRSISEISGKGSIL